jgi:hypothetical protein
LIERHLNVNDALPSSSASEAEAKARRLLVVACAVVAGGLAVAGTADPTAGGVVVLVGWLTGVAALHRLGRAGSEPRP